MVPMVSKNFGLKGGTLDATKHIENVLDRNKYNEALLKRVTEIGRETSAPDSDST